MTAFSRFLQTRVGRVGSVLLICACTFFVHLGAPEVGLMEARNFVAAREMVAGGSWLIPTMNGALRLAKPPLPTWAVAALQTLTGPTDNVGILRLPAASMATLLVFFFWGLARELTRWLPGEEEEPGRTAWLAAVVLASSLLLVTVGRDGQWDIFSNAWMVGCLWLLVHGLRTGALGAYAGAGVLLGFTILSKGPVALYALLLPFLVVYSTRVSPRPVAMSRLGVGTLLFMVIGGMVGGFWPWYVWSHVQPEVLAVARVEVASWGERHVQALWYYLNFPVFTGVWALIALVSLVVPYARRRAAGYVPYMFCLGWLLLTLVLLSVVPEKKERYMLPLMLPQVLLLTGLLRSWETTFRSSAASRSDRVLVRLWGGLLLIVCVALPVLMLVVALPGFTRAEMPFWLVSCVAGILGMLTWWFGFRTIKPAGLMLVSVILMGSVMALLMPAYPQWENRKAEAGIERMQDVRGKLDDKPYRWYSLTTLHIKQVWAAGRTVPRWQPDTTRLLATPIVIINSQPTVSAAALGKQLPPITISKVDSFYVGRDQKSEQLFVFLVRPLL
ncbi:ArnT family glycosyltransferase [Hymenobacter guriensis]|uniref:Glycosyltransferase family 39 protein n=1 Tax=Hymenobacter guriensis TaxID=2793065 RepID=A0ABS0L3M1_9BACT|nr:glycosyltransferase family 39 protein [Hymenobacter guriensis]MBG8554741.1 glycosyltransferase family 39 protein [Hymenobacter guriensis]